MANFWESSVWGFFNLLAVLLLSLLIANILRRKNHWLKESLIPTSVLGGGILLIFAAIYSLITGDNLFDTEFFGGNGSENLELITYHALALGFIASSFKTSDQKLTKERTVEILNTGVTTVCNYLMQGVLGLVITLIAAQFMSGFFAAAGILLPFGYGQGTGQALNYGNIYETEFGFVGGKSFGLSVAALGFLSASIGGVIYLAIQKRKGNVVRSMPTRTLSSEEIQSADDSPMQDSIDKLTIQVALVTAAYLLAYLLMVLLGNLLPGMRSVIFGFNFLLGVLTATLMKQIIGILRKKNIMKHNYVSNFLMTRVCNFFFDIMVVSGIAAIRLSVLEEYWAILLVLSVFGAGFTFWYNHYIAHTLFPAYAREQFLAMYGMLTGTASTGVILLREVDGDFKTPVADNLVYQNFPAIVLGFPIMLLANMAPTRPVLTLVILTVLFIVMNILLFRSKIFKKK